MTSLRTNWKNEYGKVFLIGLLTSFLFFLPFLIYDNGYFLYYGDFNVQQIPFYSLAHDAVQNGELGWNWNTDLGANFIGSYSFYLLGSPFFWLTLLFPSSAVPYLMAPLLMLKFALTGVTGFAYIKRFTKTSNMAMIGGLLYAFSGFNIYNIFFNHFQEAVLVFPLLLIAMEELILNNRRGGFALAVALCCMINYYFFFGQVLFCVLYFFVRCTSKDFKFTLRKFGILVLEAVLGLLLSAFLLLPSALAALSNPRTENMLLGYDMLVYGNSQRYGLILSSFFFPPDIPARPNFFPDSNAKWSSVSMFLPIFSMTGVFAFFKAKRKHWAKTLLLISFAICFIPILNAAFSMFNYSYYARWFYMPLLLMAMVTCVAMEDHLDCFKFGIRWTAIAVAGFAMIGILPKKVDGVVEFFKMPTYPERFWVYVLIAAIGLLCTGVLVILTPKHHHFQKYAVISVCGVTVITSCFMMFTGKQASGVAVEENGEHTYYNQVVNEGLHGREQLSLEDDEGFYRIDTYDEMDNLGMFWRIPTINAFQSVVPSSIMEYYQEIGGERGVASRPKPSMDGVRGLLSVKYRFISTAEERGKLSVAPAGFSYWDTQNGYDIYKNDHFVPMGFTYDALLTQNQFNSVRSDYRDCILLRGLLLSDEDVYLYSDTLGVLPILSQEELNNGSFDTATYFEDCDRRAEQTVDSFTYNSYGFTSSITLEKENLVFFSVPYEEGWSAYVNGKEVPIVKANIGFMAVLAEAGENEIVFTYETPGLKTGFLISVVALLLLIGYLLLVRRQRKLHPEYRYQPNGHRAFLEISPEDAAVFEDEEGAEPSAAEEGIFLQEDATDDGAAEDMADTDVDETASDEEE